MIRLLDRWHTEPLWPSWSSLIRVLLLAGLLTAAGGSVLSNLPDTGLVSMFDSRLSANASMASVERARPVGFRDVAAPPGHVAWIAGSSINMRLTDQRGRVGWRLLPDIVASRLNRTGMETHVSIYLLQAAALYETLLAVEHARSGDPAAIVVAVNPWWVFNTHAISRWENLRAIGLGLVPREVGTLGLHLAQMRPGQLVDFGLGRISGMPIAGYALNLKAQTALNRWNPAVRQERKVPKPIEQMTGPDFWRAYSGAETTSEYFAMATSMDEDQLNHRILRRIVKSLAAFDGPAAVYVPPLNPAYLRKEGIAEIAADIGDEVERVVAVHGDGMVRFWDHPGLHPPAGAYRDHLHLKDKGRLDRTFAILVKRLVLEGNEEGR